MTPERLRASARRRFALAAANLLWIALTWAASWSPDAASALCVGGTLWALRAWTLEGEAWRWSQIAEAWRARAGLDAMGLVACTLTVILAARQQALGAGLVSVISAVAMLGRLGWTWLERRRIVWHAALEDRTGAQLPWSTLRVDGPWVEALTTGERLHVRQGPPLGAWGAWGIGGALLLAGASLAPWTSGGGLILWAPALLALGWGWVQARQGRARLEVERDTRASAWFEGSAQTLPMHATFSVHEEDGYAVVSHRGEKVHKGPSCAG